MCDEIVCDLNTLTITVVKGEMDGYTFQCVHIDHRNNILYLGDITELEVDSLPEGFNGTARILTAIFADTTTKE